MLASPDLAVQLTIISALPKGASRMRSLPSRATNCFSEPPSTRQPPPPTLANPSHTLALKNPLTNPANTITSLAIRSHRSIASPCAPVSNSACRSWSIWCEHDITVQSITCPIVRESTAGSVLKADAAARMAEMLPLTSVGRRRDEAIFCAHMLVGREG